MKDLIKARLLSGILGFDIGQASDFRSGIYERCMGHQGVSGKRKGLCQICPRENTIWASLESKSIANFVDLKLR